MYRLGLRIKVRGAFLLSSLIIAAVMLMPRVGLSDYHWSNGLYELLCVLLVFPAVLMIGAGSNDMGRRTTSLCQSLGRISYPLYITHYPLIYILFDWTYKHPDMPQSVHIFNGVAVFLLTLGVAYACERLYDMPVRTWLANRFLKSRHR